MIVKKYTHTHSGVYRQATETVKTALTVIIYLGVIVLLSEGIHRFVTYPRSRVVPIVTTRGGVLSIVQQVLVPVIWGSEKSDKN